MRVTVFGAGNEVGQAVVDHLVGRGFQVLVLVPDHAPGIDGPDPDVTVLRGSITDAAAVAQAVAQGDVVVNALDPRLDRRAGDGDLVAGTGHIVAAMQAHGVRRYIGLGGPVTGLYPHERPSAWLRTHRVVTSALHPHRYRQKQLMLSAVTGADLDWTIVRFAHCVRGAGRGLNYVGYFGRDHVGSWVSAADIAGFVAAQVLSTRFIGAAPAISH